MLFRIAHSYMQYTLHLSGAAAATTAMPADPAPLLEIAADSLPVQATVQQHTRRSAQCLACRFRLPPLSCKAALLHVQCQRSSVAGPHVHIQVLNAYVVCQLHCCMDQLGCHALPE